MIDAQANDAYANLVDLVLQPTNAHDAVFSEPWMARAFGLVVALSEKHLFGLNDFQAALIEAVGRHEKTGCVRNDTEYYTCWLEALMALLRNRALLSQEALSAIERTLVVESAARKEHQHQIARNPNGSLKIAPIVVA